MAIRVHCSNCEANYRVAEKLIGKTIRCRACQTKIKVNPVQEEPLEEVDDSLLAKVLKIPRYRPVLTALCWAFLGFALAVALPWLALYPPGLVLFFGWCQLLFSILLIAWNLVLAVHLVGRTGQILLALPNTCAQFFLFPLLFFQIACVQGSSHYECQHVPSALDWAIFVAAHGFRAADFLDTLQAFGLNVQTIKHNSVWASLWLMIFHIVLDFFAIGLLLDVFNRMKRTYLARATKESEKSFVNQEDSLLQWRRGRLKITKTWFGAMGIFIMVWLWTVLLIRPWQWSDMALWPLENCLRVLDVVDFMEIFNFHLHGISGIWEGILAVAFRLLMASVFVGLLAVAFQEISLRFAHGFGLGEEDLEDLALSHPDPDLREKAADRLELMRKSHWRESEDLLPTRWLPKEGWVAVAGCALVSLLALLILGQWGNLIANLADTAVDENNPNAGRAVAYLKHMGMNAESASPIIAGALSQASPKYKKVLLDTLGCLGPSSLPVLEENIQGKDEQLALIAVQALEHVGPRAAPAYLVALHVRSEPVRKIAHIGLINLGSDGVQPLLDGLKEETIPLSVYYLERLDPYWTRLSSDNPLTGKIRTLGFAIRTLRNQGSDARDLEEAVGEIMKLEVFTEPALPYLSELLIRNEIPTNWNDRALGWKRDVPMACIRALVAYVKDEATANKAVFHLKQKKADQEALNQLKRYFKQTKAELLAQYGINISQIVNEAPISHGAYALLGMLDATGQQAMAYLMDDLTWSKGERAMGVLTLIESLPVQPAIIIPELEKINQNKNYRGPRDQITKLIKKLERR